MIIAAPILFGRLHVLPIARDLLEAHPALAVRLSLSDRNVSLVDEGIDAAVRIGDLADSSLIAVRLGAVSRVVVASPDYLVRRGSPAAPADLAGHDTIAFEGLDVGGGWRFGDGEKAVRIQPRLGVNSGDATIAAAEAGVGIARPLSYQVRASVEAGRLVVLLQDHAPPAIPVSIVYPARRIASANVAAFVKAARSRFRSEPLVPVEDWTVRARGWPD
jgi:DNA-binding transcriptional LysR family regulator